MTMTKTQKKLYDRMGGGRFLMGAVSIAYGKHYNLYNSDGRWDSGPYPRSTVDVMLRDGCLILDDDGERIGRG